MIRTILTAMLTCAWGATGFALPETPGAQESQMVPQWNASMNPHTSRELQLTTGPSVWRADEPATFNGLWGKNLTIEVGHGRTWLGSSWGWQREDWFPGLHMHSSREDFNTARMVNRWLYPYLRRAGADVYITRCPDEQQNEVIIDVPSVGAPYTYNGNWEFWQGSSAYGGGYLRAYSSTDITPSANLQVRATIPEDGYYGVTVYYTSFGSTSSPDVSFTVVDAAGYRHPYRVDQQRNGRSWVLLDKHYFEAGTDVLVLELHNGSSVPDKLVALDCVRLGGGMGTEDFGGGPSGVPRWQEAATNWIKYNNAPSYVWNQAHSESGDVAACFYFADYKQSDLLLRFHTNGSVNHTGFGSGVFLHGINSDTQRRLGFVNPKMVQSIRQHYRQSWTDRGVRNTTPSAWPFTQLLVELGFHDWLTDAEAIMDADFRRVATRGLYEGLVDYYTDRTGIYMPEPPENIALTNLGNLSIEAQWTTPAIGPAPDSYRVYYSKHPYCYKDYVETPATVTRTNIGPLDPNEIYYFQLRAANAGGLSLESETLAAMVSDAADVRKVLLINGFDRFDWDIDETDNHRNYCIQHATAIADAATSLGMAVSIDSSSNEAVAGGNLSLAGYAMVDWMLGQESVADETFSAQEQAAIKVYRQEAGVLLGSGSNIALDLAKNGTTEDRDFFNKTLGASFIDARIDDVTTLTAAISSIFDGLNLQVNKSGSIYNVLGTDVIRTSPVGNESVTTEIGFRHNGGIVGVYSVEQPQPLFTFTVPLEVIDGADARRALLERILPHMPDKAGVGQWSLY